MNRDASNSCDRNKNQQLQRALQQLAGVTIS